MNKGDFIRITNLQIYGHHGVYSEEKEKGQTFIVNANVYYDMSCAGESDQLDEALNYAELCQFIDQLLKKKNFDLLEAAASFVCERILLSYPQVTVVELELCKPNAPIGLPFENVSVNLTRAWHKVYLSIGSNMGDKKKYLTDAIKALQEEEKIRNVKASSIIETKPYGYEEQDAFLNGAVELETIMQPQRLLSYLQAIEAESKRERKIHWGPRTLDLDILFYDDLIMETKNLIIPHVDIENRDFVLRPMNEIAPHYVHPSFGKTIHQMFEELNKGC